MGKPVLVMGVGNLLLSDEGIGVHVARRLQSMRLPSDVEVIDGGTGGFELIGFLSGRARVVIVDCLAADAPVGTMICATPDQLDLRWGDASSAHQSGLSELLYHARLLVPPPEIVILGVVGEIPIQPGIGLSEFLEPLVDEIASQALRVAQQSPSVCQGPA
jgi:hydrogenase maturation protease